MLMLYLTKSLTEAYERERGVRKQLEHSLKELHDAHTDWEKRRRQWDDRMVSMTKLLRSHHLPLLPSVFGD